MLLVFVGPLLSQARDMGQGGVPEWMGELACAAEHGDAGHQPAIPDHEMSWAKCGYCTLLFNSPALSPAPSTSWTWPASSVRMPRWRRWPATADGASSRAR